MLQFLKDRALAINSNRAVTNSKSIISLTNPIREM